MNKRTKLVVALILAVFSLMDLTHVMDVHKLLAVIFWVSLAVGFFLGAGAMLRWCLRR